MFETVYIEREVIDHPRAKAILKRFPSKRLIVISRYTEIFNAKGQNFRLQKNLPSLIIAKKHGKFLHPIPKNYGIGHEKNFYFSHLLNCPFDCSYCFLQGMFRSANYVLFVNYEDCMKEMDELLQDSLQKISFFSGYDADSLALESLTGFIKAFFPYFSSQKNGFLEIRTKSTAIAPLLSVKPITNCVIAYSLNPASIIERYEKKTPSLLSRIEALQKLQSHGYQIGFRFDPLIPCERAIDLYSDFFDLLFSHLKPSEIHSVTLGVIRLPTAYYQNMKKIHADDELLYSLQKNKDMAEHPDPENLKDFCSNYLSKLFSKRLFIT